MKSSLKRLDIVYRIVHILEIYFMSPVICPVMYVLIYRYIFIPISVPRVINGKITMSSNNE